MDTISLLTCIGSLFQLQNELATHVLRHAGGTAKDRWKYEEGFEYLPLNPGGIRIWLENHGFATKHLFDGTDLEFEVIRTRDIKAHYHAESDSVLISRLVANDTFGTFRFDEKIVCTNLMENQMIVVPKGTVHGFSKMFGSFYLIGIHSPPIRDDDVHYV